MVEILTIPPLIFASNCYFVFLDRNNAVAIDPGEPYIAARARQFGVNVRYVLLTHGHFDHTGGCAELQAEGAKIGCLAEEVPLLNSTDNMARAFGQDHVPFRADFTLKDGEKLSLCGMEFSVIATPGHTAGGAVYVCERNLFTGDTLFQGTVGRCDLPTGSGSQLESSVRKLYALEGDFEVYPGHGDKTTLETERNTNEVIRI